MQEERETETRRDEEIEAPEAFLAGAGAAGIEFAEGDLRKLGRFLALLLEANRDFNLTAIRDPDEAWMRHVLDSLMLLPHLDALAPRALCDVGSGGGLPGMPLAIVLPALRVTLLEATGKKARFLERTAAALELHGVEVVNERAESYGQDAANRERFDVAVARAVGTLPVLLELTLPLVRLGGHVLAIKGEKAGAEIESAARALSLLGGAVVDTRRTPTGTIVVVEKVAATPRPYPRRPGEPKRAPL